jgi:osmotically-inducible protein OsmY
MVLQKCSGQGKNEAMNMFAWSIRLLLIAGLLASCSPRQQSQTQSEVQHETARARVDVSNGALEVRVGAAIAAEAGTNVLHITPVARGGIVTLTGTVPSPTIHRTVIDTVRAVPGVKAVVDRLNVR